MFPEDVAFTCLDTLTSAVTPDLTSDVNRKPGKHCQIPGDIHFMYMDAPVSELETDYSQKHRISQVILIESPEHPCLGPEVRSPVIGTVTVDSSLVNFAGVRVALVGLCV